MFPINRGPTLIINVIPILYVVIPAVINVQRKFYSPILLFATVTDLRSFSRFISLLEPCPACQPQT